MEAAASHNQGDCPPRHVAIIMDGNGRWAKARMLPRIAGHRQGAEVVRDTVSHCCELGISFLTIYAFSAENWKRPLHEIDDLMGLLKIYLKRELDELTRSGVRMRFIGNRKRLSESIITLIEAAESKTSRNTGLTLTVALNYGGRDDIVQAAGRIAEDVAAGVLESDAIDEDLFESYLATAGIPDPDLLIRTSGEQRVSNFLLWQTAYTELVFTPVLWPDFNTGHLEDAITEFHRRERRYGASSD